MNVRCGLSDIVFMICFLVRSLLCQLTSDNHSLNIGTPDHSETAVSHSRNPTDTMQTGINNLVNILENIETISEAQLKKTLEEDVQKTHMKTIGQRLPRSTEYQPFSCGVSCYLQLTDQETRLTSRSFRTATHTGKQYFVLNCVQGSSPQLRSSSLHPVSIDCVSHFTGSLIHVVLRLEKENRRQIEQGITKIGDNFASALATIGRMDSSSTGAAVTGFYLTLNVPITELEYEDLRPLKPWLKYVSLNGEFLKSVDKHILKELTLNYFVLEGCTRRELIFTSVDEVDHLTESSLPRCRVMWRFTCSNSTPLELWADEKTHKQLCGIKNGNDGTRVLAEHRPRKRRAIYRMGSNMESKARASFPQTTTRNLYSQLSMVTTRKSNGKLDHETHSSGVNERQDILWYQNIILILLSLIALLSILLGLTVVALLLVIRRTLRGKLKPV